MEHRSAHKTVDITYNIRQKRVCFVVRDLDIVALRRAMEIACFSWGGFFSSFVITKDNSGLTNEQLKQLRIYDPDELVIMSDSDQYLLQKYRNLGISVVSHTNISNPFRSPIGIPMNAILHDSETKNTQKNDKKPKLLMPSYPKDAFELGYLLKYGLHISNSEEDSLLNIFRLPTSSKLATYFDLEEPNVDNQFRTYIDNLFDRLANETEYVYDLPSLTKFRTTWHNPRIFYMQDDEFRDNPEPDDDSTSEIIFVLSKDSNSFDDFALAWNLQSKRPFFNLPISPFPILLPPDVSDADIEYAIQKSKNTVAGLHIPINGRVYFTSSTLSTAELDAKSLQFGVIAFPATSPSLLKKDFITGEENGSYGFSNGDFVRIATPKFENFALNMGSYAIDFLGEGIVPPRNQNTSHFPYINHYSRASNFGITEVKSVGVHSANEQKISLSSPGALDILKGYVRPYDTKIKLSESGKTGSLAKLLLNDEIFHELKIISNEKIFNLLEKMKKIKGRSLYTRYWKTSTGPLVGEIETRLGASTASNVQKTLDDIYSHNIARLEKDINNDRALLTFEQIKGELQTTPKLTTAILEWFLDNHVLERRASILCRVCGQSILLRLDQIGQNITCSKCFKDFNFVNPKDEIIWYYCETESWAELQTSDVLPSLLTLLYLEFKETAVDGTSMMGGWTGMDYSFTKDNGDEFKAEIDITAFVHRELVLGEAKIKSREFITDHGKKQLERMIVVAMRLEVKYLILSSLDVASKSTRNQITRLAKNYGFEGKLLFYDKLNIFNQEVGHFLPTDNAATHLSQTVETYLKYWEEKRRDSIY